MRIRDKDRPTCPICKGPLHLNRESTGIKTKIWRCPLKRLEMKAAIALSSLVYVQQSALTQEDHWALIRGLINGAHEIHDRDLWRDDDPTIWPAKEQ